MKFPLILFFMLTARFVFGQAGTPLITDTNYVYKSLSIALQNPDQVYRLDLSKHKLKKFPDDIFKLAHLHELNLSHNHITAIPPEIANLKELQRLTLSNNNIDSLPDQIGELHDLVFLG